MRLPKQEKIDAVGEITERIKGSKVAILTKYVGINAEQATQLRRKLRELNVSLKVYKNSLAKRALDHLGVSAAAEFMVGPTAWAFSGDPVAPTKALRDFNKEVPQVEMRGGILEGKVVSKSQLETLATLPPREVLIAQVVGAIAMPLRQLVGVLSATPRDLVNVLDQIRKQKETQQAA